MKVKSLSCVRLLEPPWTAAYQAPPSMGFSRQECWSGVPSPSNTRSTQTLVCIVLLELLLGQTEALILGLPDGKSPLSGKDPDAGKD